MDIVKVKKKQEKGVKQKEKNAAAWIPQYEEFYEDYAKSPPPDPYWPQYSKIKCVNDFSLGELKLMADQFVEFARRDDTLTLTAFANENDLSYSTFVSCMKKTLYGIESFELGRNIIASRREEYALKNKINPSVYSRTQPLYDRALSNLIQWKLKLQESHEQKVIIMESFDIKDKEDK